MNKRILYLLIIFLFFLGIYLSLKYFDKSIFLISNFDKQIIQENDSHLLNSELGFLFNLKASRLFMGKRAYFFNKFLNKAAYPLDFRPYLEKYPLFYFVLPFLFAGLFYLVKNFLFEFFIYLVLAMFFSILLPSERSLLLYLPLFFFSIFLGFCLFLRFMRRSLKL